MKVIIDTQLSCLQIPKEIILRVKKSSKISSVLSFISQKFYFPESSLIIHKDSAELSPNQEASVLRCPAKLFLHSVFPEALFEKVLKEIESGTNESFLNKFLEACEQGYSLDKILDDKGWALLHYACFFGNDLVASNLIVSNEKSINLCTKDGWTPLMIASNKGFGRVVKVLLSVKRTKVNKLTCQGSALHRAVSSCHAEVVKLLIKHKADVKLEDFDNKTCMELQTSQEILELIPTLNGINQVFRSFCLNDSDLFEFKVHRVGKRFSKDYLCKLSINFENGRLEEFLLNGSKSLLVFKKKIVKLVHVEVSAVPFSNEKFYFKIVFSSHVLKYWANSREYRDKIVESIKKSADFCKWREIGVRNYSLLEGLKSKKSSVIEIESKHQKTAKLKEFEKVKTIGSGSFGTVYLIKHIYTGEMFALKSTDKDVKSPKGRTKFAITECEILKSLNSPFIVKLYWAIATSNHLNLILEYCPGADLSMILSAKGRLNESETRFVLGSVVLGLKHLHLKGVICRDLKPANILLDQSGYFKLCDFGLSQNRVEGDKMNAKLVGSPTYLSPEGILSNKVGKCADIWALGVVTYQILTGSLPFMGNDYDDLYEHIIRKELKYPSYISHVYKSFLQATLNRDPQSRLDIDQVMSHKIFEGLDWKVFFDRKYEPPEFIKQHLSSIHNN